VQQSYPRSLFAGVGAWLIDNMEPSYFVYGLGAVAVLFGTVLFLSLSLERNSYLGVLVISVSYSGGFWFLAQQFESHEHRVAACILAVASAALELPSCYAVYHILKIWPEHGLAELSHKCAFLVAVAFGAMTAHSVAMFYACVPSALMIALASVSFGMASFAVLLSLSATPATALKRLRAKFEIVYGLTVFVVSVLTVPHETLLFTLCGSFGAALCWDGISNLPNKFYKSTTYSQLCIAMMVGMSYCYPRLWFVTCLGLVGYFRLPLARYQYSVVDTAARSVSMLAMWYIALQTVNVLLLLLACGVFFKELLLSLWIHFDDDKGRLEYETESARVLVTSLVALQMLLMHERHSEALVHYSIALLWFEFRFASAVRIFMQLRMAAFVVCLDRPNKLRDGLLVLECVVLMALPLVGYQYPEYLACLTFLFQVQLVLPLALSAFVRSESSANNPLHLLESLLVASLGAWITVYPDPWRLVELLAFGLLLFSNLCHFPANGLWRVLFLLSNAALMSHAGAIGHRLLLIPGAFGIVRYMVELASVFRGSFLYPLALSVGGLGLLKVGTYLPEVNELLVSRMPSLSPSAWALALTGLSALLTLLYSLVELSTIDRVLTRWHSPRRFQATPELRNVRLTFAPPDNPAHTGIKVTINCTKTADFTFHQAYLAFDSDPMWAVLRRTYGSFLIATVRATLYPFALSPTYLDITPFNTNKTRIEATLCIRKTFRRILEKYAENNTTLPIKLEFSGGSGTESGFSDGILCTANLDVNLVLARSRRP